MKISILLPYKENFSPNYAGAVSLFVKDTILRSTYYKNISVYGNTNYKKKLLPNYINLSLDKKFYQSGSKIYVDKFLDYEINNKSNLIEVHNRPNYVKFLREKINTKIFLYFHNDPLTMSGSITISDRLYLLENTHKLIFNSNWSKERFFVGMKNKIINFNNISVVHQSAERTSINLKKKQNIISFIGKLNKAKGYDLFGSAIVKILNKHQDWKAIVLGDEPREKLIFKHNNLKILGFKNHDYVLNILKKVSISVVCSRWDEPFGRTSLEAASRGCAIIISNRGGLPETTNDALVLNNLSEKEIFKKIDYLIKNKQIRQKYQKNNLINFKLTHDFVADILDKLRIEIFNISNLFNVKINKDSKFKILHITNFNDRHNGRLHYNTGRRLNNGFIRLGHNVLTISDRDIISKGKKINDIKGIKSFNKKVIDTYKNFKPNIIIMGHADGLNLKTIEQLKEMDENLKFSQWFLDPISKMGPDFIKNRNRILHKSSLLDSNFLTTDPKSLSFKIKNSYFMPNPCDQSFEILENYNQNCQNDIFFAMSHGVHRGELKKGKIDDREIFINRLRNKCSKVKFDIYGMNNVQPIWGNDFLSKISNSKMALNLSRGKPIKYYSSDRIAQLLGNGLLTFIDKRTMFKDFLDDNEIIFYKNLEDLSDKILRYKKDDKKRRMIAKNGKKAYFNYFNSNIVADFILSKTFNYKSKFKFVWSK